MNRIINDTLRIFLITLIAGVLLGATYMITKDPIEEAEKNAKIEAYSKVFEDAADFHDEIACLLRLSGSIRPSDFACCRIMA